MASGVLSQLFSQSMRWKFPSQLVYEILLVQYRSTIVHINFESLNQHQRLSQEEFVVVGLRRTIKPKAYGNDNPSRTNWILLWLHKLLYKLLTIQLS
jgi:hypothetical protein